jgi:hopene-associated glycosyltransferase HpnB
MEFLVGAGSLCWFVLLLAPWRPWDTQERLENDTDLTRRDFSDITVLIPARNEAGVIKRTLSALQAQGRGFLTVLIDDQSSDGTGSIARTTLSSGLTILQGGPLPEGWTGKLWALEQGWRRVDSKFVLLLDADIELQPGMLAALRNKIRDLDLVSVMAELRMQTFWERLLVPAFIYFFKLVYPFSVGNDPHTRLGVAAGGCMLLRCDALRKIGGFEPLRSAIIDDCSIAKKIKEAGGRTWVGLSRAVRSHRPCERLSDFWQMIARTAFTQLRYSLLLLLGTTALMVLSFWMPLVGLFAPSEGTRGIALAGFAAMVISYLPTLRYYRRSRLWSLALPVIGTLYLLMTWSSAARFWQGKRSEWKGRIYARSPFSHAAPKKPIDSPPEKC